MSSLLGKQSNPTSPFETLSFIDRANRFMVIEPINWPYRVLLSMVRQREISDFYIFSVMQLYDPIDGLLLHVITGARVCFTTSKKGVIREWSNILQRCKMFLSRAR